MHALPVTNPAPRGSMKRDPPYAGLGVPWGYAASPSTGVPTRSPGFSPGKRARRPGYNPWAWSLL